MRHWRTLVLAIAVGFLPAEVAAAAHRDHSKTKVHINRKDSAFVHGYDDGYRQGAKDAHALSNAYRDESDPIYEQASDGYTSQYGDEEAYKRRFRRGFVEGYKAGWDFEAGAYGGGRCSAWFPWEAKRRCTDPISCRKWLGSTSRHLPLPMRMTVRSGPRVRRITLFRHDEALLVASLVTSTECSRPSGPCASSISPVLP